MEEDKRQAWRNVKLGMDTFDEERGDQNTPRGAQGGSSGEEDKGSMSRSVSQSGRMLLHHQDRKSKMKMSRRGNLHQKTGRGRSA
jgi:hypothetical protein